MAKSMWPSDGSLVPGPTNRSRSRGRSGGGEPAATSFTIRAADSADEREAPLVGEEAEPATASQRPPALPRAAARRRRHRPTRAPGAPRRRVCRARSGAGARPRRRPGRRRRHIGNRGLGAHRRARAVADREGLRIREGALRHLHRGRAEGARRGVPADDRHRLLHSARIGGPPCTTTRRTTSPRTGRARSRTACCARCRRAATLRSRSGRGGPRNTSSRSVRRPAASSSSSCSMPTRCAPSTRWRSMWSRSAPPNYSSHAGLIAQTADDAYHPEQFVDDEKQRILAAVERKIAGRAVADARAPLPSAQVIDLVAALRASLDALAPAAERPDAATRKAEVGAARESRAPRRQDATTAAMRGRRLGRGATIGAMNDLSAFPITRKWPARHPTASSSTRCRRRTASRSRSCSRRPASPYEPHRVDFDTQRPEVAGVPVAQPEQQDPGDHRSRRPGRQAARAVRVGRDPALPRRQDRPAHAGRCRRGATRRSSG